MRSVSIFGSGVLGLVLCACGGSQPPPADAPEPPAETAPAEEPEPESTEADGGSEEPAPEEAAKPEPKAPEFKENGTVDEAIAAIPPGSERLNLDQETLAKPLQEMSLYEPCRPGSARIKFRVAVWDGKVVGLDLTATPKSPKLEECLKGRIREVTWKDKVKALNTVEYSF